MDTIYAAGNITKRSINYIGKWTRSRKPILDEQQLEIDALVKEAIRDQFTVKLVYYEGKKLLNLKGKLREERGNLYLDDKYLVIDNIMDITLI